MPYNYGGRRSAPPYNYGGRRSAPPYNYGGQVPKSLFAKLRMTVVYSLWLNIPRSLYPFTV
jgi:hypothetical protein